MILLKSSDNKSFKVEEAVALQSQMIAHMVEDNCTNKGIQLANVTGEILGKVIEYCEKHADSDCEDLKQWDAEFVNIDHSTIFDLIMASNYLNIEGLFDLTCQTIAEQKAKLEINIMNNERLLLRPKTSEGNIPRDLAIDRRSLVILERRIAQLAANFYASTEAAASIVSKVLPREAWPASWPHSAVSLTLRSGTRLVLKYHVLS